MNYNFGSHNIYYFGTGALHTKFIGVYGNSYMRLPLMQSLNDSGHKIIWFGFNYEEKREAPILEILGIKKDEKELPNLKKNVETISYKDVQNHLYGIPLNPDKDLEEKEFYKAKVAQKKQNGNLDHQGILFIELRPWVQEKEGYNFNEESHAQKELIEFFIKKQLPIFVHDQDLWALEIPQEYRQHIHLLCSYTQLPDKEETGFKSVDFFLSGWDENYLKKYNPDREILWDTAYCGNVYGRKDDFLKFMKPLHDAGHSIVVAGNWLRKKYDDRDFSLDNFPNAIFLGQTEHWSTLPLLSKSRYAVHFANPQQQEAGLIGVRVFEAFMAGVVLFVNKNIKGIENFVHESQLVSDGEEVLEKLQVLDLDKVYSLWKKKIQKHDIINYRNKLLGLMAQYLPKYYVS